MEALMVTAGSYRDTVFILDWIGRVCNTLLTQAMFDSNSENFFDLDTLNTRSRRKLARRLCLEKGINKGTLAEIRRMSRSREVSLRKLAANISVFLVDSFPKEILDVSIHLSEDEDWWVREEATYPIKQFLLGDCVLAWCRFQEEARGHCPRRKRCIVVAAGRAALVSPQSKLKKLLRIVDTCANEPDYYVRKNLGPFAIGSYFLSAHPKITLPVIWKWSRSADPIKRWNAAMSFSAASGKRYRKEAVHSLSMLLNDEVSMVRNAARRTWRKLGLAS